MLTANHLCDGRGRAGLPDDLRLTVKLNDGTDMPAMCYGTVFDTQKQSHEEIVRILEEAIDVGYRHIDTASMYHTEQAVGEAVKNKIQAGTISRKDVYITTKLWGTEFNQKDVMPALKEALKIMGLDYVDIFLLHWPLAFKRVQPENGKFPTFHDFILDMRPDPVDLRETWQGMELCVTAGLTRSIGVSNFNSKQLVYLRDSCRIPPAVNQIETHPYLTNTKLVEFCQKKDVAVMAYSPLFGSLPLIRESKGWPILHEEETLKDLARTYKATTAQVALAFQLQRGVVVAVKSCRRERMEENFAAQLLNIQAEDRARIETCNKGHRIISVDWARDHPEFPFNEEF